MRCIVILGIALTLLATSPVAAQVAAWELTYGDTTSPAIGVSTVEMPQGGFITVGRSDHAERAQIVLYRISEDGTVLGQRRLSSPGLAPVFAYVRDSHCVIVGTRVRSDSDATVFTMSVDDALQFVEPPRFPDESIGIAATMARRTGSGDVIICGRALDSAAVAVVLRLSDESRIVWHRRIALADVIAPQSELIVSAIRELADGRIVIAGNGTPPQPNGEGPYPTKPVAAILSATGDVQVRQALPSSDEIGILVNDVIELADHALLFAGATHRVLNRMGSGRVVYLRGILLCTDPTLTMKISEHLLDLGKGHQRFDRVERAFDNQIVALATAGDFKATGLEDYYFDNAPYLVSISERCTIERSRRVGREGPDDYFGELRPLRDGGFAITGGRSRWQDQYLRRREFVAVIRTQASISDAPARELLPRWLDLW